MEAIRLFTKVNCYNQGDKMDRDTTRDQNIKENETFDGDCLDLPDIPLPETDNVLYSILNSLNQNIADFHTFVKFNPYLSEDHLNVELLKRSMGILKEAWAFTETLQLYSCTPKRSLFLPIQNS